jgi:drug/metabolite transporter superfamily protein YnfA
MNCLKCNAKNGENSNFCIKCGKPLLNTQKEVNINSSSDYYIIFFLIFTIILELTQHIIVKFVENWWEGTSYTFYLGIYIVYGFLFILLPFSIKNKAYKTTGFVLAIILTLIIIFRSLSDV